MSYSKITNVSESELFINELKSLIRKKQAFFFKFIYTRIYDRIILNIHHVYATRVEWP